MMNWFYQWYDGDQAKGGLDELADRQISLFLDGYAASAAKANRGHAA
jgi:hypothetical protein